MVSSESSFVEATLYYLGDVEGIPTAYTYEPPPGVPKRIPKDVRTVAIHDGRAELPTPTLEKEGFQLFDHPAGVLEDFYDETAIERDYYPAVVALIREATGAKDALVFDHTYRSSRELEEGEHEGNAPVYEVHSDYTEVSGPERAREAAAGRYEEDLSNNRFMIINVWRSINGAIEEEPLAVCDAQSMEAEDYVPAQVKFPTGRTGNVVVAKHRASHRWLYFPGMRTDEALMFKTFDPNATGASRYGAHTAFSDPTSPPDARIRESIETRAVAIF